MIGYLAVAIAKLINIVVRWLVQMKEYAEDDGDICTEVATLDDGFENDLGGRRASAVKRRPQMSNSVMDSFFGPSPVHSE